MAKQTGTSMPKGMRQRSNRNAMISVALVAILVATVSYDYASTSSGIEGQGRLQQAQLSLDHFRASLPDMLAPIDDFMLTGNAADKQRLGTAFIVFQRMYSEVSALPDLGMDQNRQLKQVFDLLQRTRGIAQNILTGGAQPGQSKDLALVAQSLVSTAQAKVGQVATDLGVQLRQREQELQQRMMTMAAVNLALIVLLLLVFIMLSRGVVKAMARTLADVAADAHTASNAVVTAADQQVEAVENQSLSLDTMTRDLEQMSATAKKISATAAGVERISDAAMRSAERGGKDVGEIVDSLRRIRDAVHTVSERVMLTQQRAERIVESLASVQEVAEETHLLALNASIESASSGKHGKRFAVVAAEVRHLSDRVREFTEEIEGVIGEVNASAEASAEATQGGLARIEQGIGVAQRAVEALGQMQTMSDKTGQAVRAIAQATSRQDRNNRAFLEALRQMAQLLHDSAQQMQELQHAGQRVMGLAEDLQKLR